MINSTERSDILVFNCYLCHVRYLLTCYVYSTKIGEISDISKCFENFVSQALGVLTRIYAAELRYNKNEFFPISKFALIRLYIYKTLTLVSAVLVIVGIIIGNITLWYSSAFVCGISFVLGCLLAVKYMKGGGFYF